MYGKLVQSNYGVYNTHDKMDSSTNLGLSALGR